MVDEMRVVHLLGGLYEKTLCRVRKRDGGLADREMGEKSKLGETVY